MALADLRRRLAQHEASRHVGAPTKIITTYPHDDAEGREAARNWQQRVKDGSASLRGGVLYLMQPPMTVEEWAARYAPPEERFQ